MDTNDVDTSPTVQVSNIALKIPPFWQQNPRLWFSQLESQFHISRVTADATKYHSVVAAIDSQVLQNISDILYNPPTVDMYETIKQRLIRHFADSEEKQLDKLLRQLELGDQRPSQLLAQMKQLCYGKLDESILKMLWLQRLPPHVQAVLVVSKEPLASLAEMGDKILDIPTQTPQIQPISTSDIELIHQLKSTVADLAEQVKRLTVEPTQPSRSSSPRRQRQRLTSRQTCWYHARYGRQARRCSSPCLYQDSKNADRGH